MEHLSPSSSKNNNNDVDNKSSILIEIKQLKSRYYESELEREGLNSLTESLKSKIRALQQQIFAQESTIKSAQDLKSQKEILLEQIERYKQKITDSESYLNTIKKEIVSLKENNNGYIRKYNELQQQNVQTQQKNNLLEVDKQQLSKKLKEIEEDNNLLNKELKQCNEQFNLIEKNRQEIKDSFEKLDLDHRRLQCKNSEFELEIEALQNNGVHPAYCNVCNKYIVGIRYKCGHCDNYDICSNCETSNHNRDHVFIKIKSPIGNDRFARTALLPEFKLIEQNEQDIDHKTVCNVCHKNIKGVRYKCGHCLKFEMCVICEAYPFNLHDPTHVFIKIKRPVQIDSNEALLPLEFRPIITKAAGV
ncbi:17506_t:CDS:2 [Funneliformis geosporum]|uniref:17506_t:CDS:1 n=1 Tax=Funneliformis geosporum TaxID=1117311 RepID=A0A9W4SVS3_9GLOM|nr:17506_t:CDS:2 [Funneliformis geosporum]